MSRSGSSRRSFLWDCWTMLTGSHVATALGVVTSYVVRHSLTPQLVGIWSAVRLILDYASFADLGANRAAAVEVATATGARDQAKARRVVAATMAIELLAAAAVGTGLCAAAYVAHLRSRPDWMLAFIATAVLLFVRRALTLALTALRSSLDFTVPAGSRVVGAALELILLAGGAIWWGLPGLLVGAVLAELLNLTFVCAVRRLNLWPRWDAATIRHLLATGAPLAAGALALMGVRSAERAVIILTAPDGEVLLGLYTTSLLIASRVFDQANLISNVLFPRLGVRFAETGDPEQVLSIGLRAAVLLTAALVPVGIGAALVGVPLTAWLLPRYEPGLDAVWGTVAAAAVLGGTLPLRHALVTLGLSWRMCGAYAAGALVAAAAALAAVQLTVDRILPLAWSAAAGAALAGLLLGAVCSWKRPRLFVKFIRLTITLGYCMASCFLLQVVNQAGWLTAAGCGVLCALPAAALLYRSWKGEWNVDSPPKGSGEAGTS